MGKHFLWDPVEDNIVKEIDDSGITIADYTTEPHLYGDLISQHRDGQSSFYHYDGQGSTTSLTNSAAVVTDTYAYSAFGELTSHIGMMVNPFQFIGRKEYYRNEAIGEYVVRERPLSFLRGRWLCTDPLRWNAIVLQQYVYSLNSPLQFYDPSGLMEVSCPVVECCCLKIEVVKDGKGIYKLRDDAPNEYTLGYARGPKGTGYFSTYAFMVTFWVKGDINKCKFSQWLYGESGGPEGTIPRASKEKPAKDGTIDPLKGDKPETEHVKTDAVAGTLIFEDNPGMARIIKEGFPCFFRRTFIDRCEGSDGTKLEVTHKLNLQQDLPPEKKEFQVKPWPEKGNSDDLPQTAKGKC